MLAGANASRPTEEASPADSQGKGAAAGSAGGRGRRAASQRVKSKAEAAAKRAAPRSSEDDEEDDGEVIDEANFKNLPIEEQRRQRRYVIPDCGTRASSCTYARCRSHQPALRA